MTTVEKRGPGRPRNETIDAAILAATVDELIERGFVAMSMESIAARAGIAKTTLYRRWSNQAELTIAAMRTFEDKVAEPPEGPVREQLLFLLDAMRQKWGNERYAAMMRRAAADGTVNPDAYRRARDRLIGPHVRRMNAVLAQAQDDGVIRADVEVEHVRQLLVSPMMSTALTLKDRVSRAQLEFTVDTVLRGLAVQPLSG